MLTLSTRHQWFIGIALVLLMAATRGHHFATLQHLPGASWAVFFLAGIYLRAVWVLPLLLIEAALLDFAAISIGGTSSYCVTPGYAMLVPAYGALWIAGRWYAGRHRFALSSVLPLSLALLGGSFACELLSSGGFYLLSGNFADPSISEFAARVARYYPSYLANVLFYTALAAVMHWLFAGLQHGRAVAARS